MHRRELRAARTEYINIWKQRVDNLILLDADNGKRD